MRRPRVAAAVAVTGLLLTACGTNTDDATPGTAGSEATPAAATPSATPSATASADDDPASVKANELGRVPVLMYHQVKPEPKGDYDQTPEEFRAELQRLYDHDYRPVTVRDLVAGKIDIPAGKHPVVLTFDDSTNSQARIGPDGAPTADTALGIMEAFAKEHPDWKSTASFYVNSSPFGDDKVLPWLVEHGYEVGVHTRDHSSLKALSDAGVQKAIGANAADIEAAAPGAKPTTISLPFGIAPVNKALLRAGTYEGGSYTLTGALLVGSNPAKSPFDAEFDPFAVPRIRSGLKKAPVLMDSRYWLDSLEANPSGVYTSDGNPDKISYPADSTAKVASKYADMANPYSEAGTGSSSGSSSGSTETASPAPTGASEASDASEAEPSATSTPAG